MPMTAADGSSQSQFHVSDVSGWEPTIWASPAASQGISKKLGSGTELGLKPGAHLWKASVPHQRLNCCIKCPSPAHPAFQECSIVVKVLSRELTPHLGGSDVNSQLWLQLPASENPARQAGMGKGMGLLSPTGDTWTEFLVSDFLAARDCLDWYGINDVNLPSKTKYPSPSFWDSCSGWSVPPNEGPQKRPSMRCIGKVPPVQSTHCSGWQPKQSVSWHQSWHARMQMPLRWTVLLPWAVRLWHWTQMHLLCLQIHPEGAAHLQTLEHKETPVESCCVCVGASADSSTSLLTCCDDLPCSAPSISKDMSPQHSTRGWH